MFGNPEEYFYLHLMRDWERTAPADRHKGVRGGREEVNTQTARMAYVLRINDNGKGKSFQTLSTYCRRNDGRSYISKDSGWMKEPYELAGGWYLEGCQSLKDKQGILQYLTKVGASPAFVPCAQDFVAGKPLEKYLPKGPEAGKQILKWMETRDLNENVNEILVRMVKEKRLPFSADELEGVSALHRKVRSDRA